MNEAATLNEQLERERRMCPQCMYVIANPFVERCPRCNALLQHLELHCTGCFHASACPVKPANVTGEQSGKLLTDKK